MKSNSPATPPSARDLRDRIKQATADSEQSDKNARMAKHAHRTARKDFKAAKKEAKRKRKELKALLKHQALLQPPKPKLKAVKRAAKVETKTQLAVTNRVVAKKTSPKAKPVVPAPAATAEISPASAAPTSEE